MKVELTDLIEPDTLTDPVLIPAEKGKPKIARGFQMDNSIDLWVCTYEGVQQLSAIVYPTELVIQYKMPLIDRCFNDFTLRKITREFNGLPVEELNAKFKAEAGSASTMSHPNDAECYLFSGKKIFEHSFVLRAEEYVVKVISVMK
jgi:hypothetical protein